MLEQPGLTITGEFVGTPAYMSPEQIAVAGRARRLDHRTDIYSLGATLYELLTLQPPFTGERRDQVLAQILHKEPMAPRKLNKKVPVDLETICLKALEKDPDRRYPTAGKLAEDSALSLRQPLCHQSPASRAGTVQLKKVDKAEPRAGRRVGLRPCWRPVWRPSSLTGRTWSNSKGWRVRARLERQLQQEQRQTALEKAILRSDERRRPCRPQGHCRRREKKDAEPEPAQYAARPWSSNTVAVRRKPSFTWNRRRNNFPAASPSRLCWPRRTWTTRTVPAQRRDVHARGTARAEDPPRTTCFWDSV